MSADTNDGSQHNEGPRQRNNPYSRRKMINCEYQMTDGAKINTSNFGIKPGLNHGGNKILIVHGNPGGGDGTGMLPSVLYRPLFAVAMPSRRGYNGSSELPSKLGQYDVLELSARDNMEIMDQDRVTQYHVGTRSGGVNHGLYLAAKDNQKVKSVTVYAPAVSPQMAKEVLGNKWADKLDQGNAKKSSMNYTELLLALDKQAKIIWQQSQESKGNHILWGFPEKLTYQEYSDIFTHVANWGLYGEEALQKSYEGAINLNADGSYNIDAWARDAHALLGGTWPIPWGEINAPVRIVSYEDDRFAPPANGLVLETILRDHGVEVEHIIRPGTHFAAFGDQKYVHRNLPRTRDGKGVKSIFAGKPATNPGAKKVMYRKEPSSLRPSPFDPENIWFNPDKDEHYD